MAELRTDARAQQSALAAQRDSELYEEKAPAASEPDAQAASQPRSVGQQYPLNMTVDFTKLRVCVCVVHWGVCMDRENADISPVCMCQANALRRYMAFHGIREVPGSCRDQLAIVVAQHFGEQCKVADEETSIASFVSYIKGIRVQHDSSGIDSQSDSSHGDFDEFELGGRGDRDHREAFAMGGALDDADTDNNSSASSSDDDCNFMSDTTPVKKTKRSHPSSSSKDRLKTQHSSSSSSSPGGGKSHSSSKSGSNKKQRKTRLYCVCKGASFGNMIACDNKKCSDRSNWYHMGCVDLDPSQDPPETWYCPSCQEIDGDDVPENQYRKPVASVTYGDMISHALTALPQGKGSFKDICDFVEKQYESQLNWKLESDQRKSPVWKSSVRKILFSNMRFRKHPDDKGLFCLAA